jgi:hypothetical protein
VISILAA